MDPTVMQVTDPAPPRSGRPWLNRKLVAGAVLVGAVVVLSLVGRLLRDPALARVASAPLNLPPFWIEGGSTAYPLGTENSGRDMLALVTVGTPLTLRIGLIVGVTSMVVGIVLGFAGGYLGGAVDAVIRLVTDTALTIPTLAILVVIAAYIREMNATTMALIIAMLAWAGPTRVIRGQVLSMRDHGYVRMARLSGQSTAGILFREMMPNLLPYLAASFIGATSGGILAAVGLEALGLGPQRVPTLGMIVSQAIQGSAILRGMWWWWGVPTVILTVIFAGLFLIATGLDEVANPRLRGARS